MDDKELIKRIMEEVKDEKLREELLALVVEKNRKEDNTKGDSTKQEEEKPIDYVSKLFIPWGLLGIYVLWKGREEYKKKFERRSKEDIE